MPACRDATKRTHQQALVLMLREPGTSLQSTVISEHNRLQARAQTSASRRGVATSCAIRAPATRAHREQTRTFRRAYGGHGVVVPEPCGHCKSRKAIELRSRRHRKRAQAHVYTAGWAGVLCGRCRSSKTCPKQLLSKYDDRKTLTIVCKCKTRRSDVKRARTQLTSCCARSSARWR